MIIKSSIFLALYWLFVASCSAQGFSIGSGLRDIDPGEPIDTMLRELYMHPTLYLDTSSFSRTSAEKTSLQYSFTRDSLFDGFWVGDYQSFIPGESSKSGVSMRIDSTTRDSVFGTGVFTSSGGVDLGLLKTPIYLRAKKRGSQLDGQIAEYTNDGFDKKSNLVYTFSFNCYNVSSTPDTSWERSDVIEGYAVGRVNSKVVPGHFIFHRFPQKDFQTVPYLLPENLSKKQR